MAENCIFIADGSLPLAPHVDSYADSDVYCLKNIPNLILRGCTLFGSTDANLSKTAYGVQASPRTVLNDCSFDITGIADSFDLHSTAARTVRLANCEYDSSQVHANVTVKEIQSYVLDAALSDHTDNGTVGERLNSLNSLDR